jgi:hypothetical protein
MSTFCVYFGHGWVAYLVPGCMTLRCRRCGQETRMPFANSCAAVTSYTLVPAHTLPALPDAA